MNFSIILVGVLFVKFTAYSSVHVNQYDGSDIVQDKYLVDDEFAKALTAWEAKTEELCGGEKTFSLRLDCKLKRAARKTKQPFYRGTDQYFVKYYKPLPTVELKRLAVELWDLSEMLDNKGSYDEWPLGAIGASEAGAEYIDIINELADERNVQIGISTRYRSSYGAPPKEWCK